MKNEIGVMQGRLSPPINNRIQAFPKNNWKDEFELASIMGNITTKENSPFIHIHATISDEECNAFAGHLFTATTAVTCEIILNISDKPIIRKECSEVGLYLWDFNCG